MNRKYTSAEAIMSEAISLGEEKGWKKVTMGTLEDKLGDQKAELHKFFKNKEALLRNLLANGFDMLTTDLNEARMSKRGASNKLLAMALARLKFAKENRAMHSLMFSTDSPRWFQKIVIDGMLQSKINVITLLKEISGRDDECIDLLSNFVAIVKGYTFMATELPTEITKDEFFVELTPEKSLEEAMKRFIKSIKPDE